MPDIAKQTLITIRPYKPEMDKNFVYATWLRGLYYGDSWFSMIPKAIFMTNYQAVIDRILSGPACEVKVACLKDDPDVILGYAVGHTVDAGYVLDWVFVKSSWRLIGVAKSLVPTQPIAVSHLTKVGRAIKPDNCDFNPFT